MTVMFLTKAVLMKDLLKHNRDSRFSTMQTKANSCRVMAMLLTKAKICHAFYRMKTT